MKDLKRVEFYGGPLDCTMLSLPTGSKLVSVIVKDNDKNTTIAEYRPDEDDFDVWYIEEAQDD